MEAGRKGGDGTIVRKTATSRSRTERRDLQERVPVDCHDVAALHHIRLAKGHDWGDRDRLGIRRLAHAVNVHSAVLCCRGDEVHIVAEE